MSGYISEFFGYRAEDSSVTALDNTSKQVCPFLSSYCTKALGDKTNGTQAVLSSKKPRNMTKNKPSTTPLT